MAEGAAQATKPAPGAAARAPAARQAPVQPVAARRTFAEPGRAAERSLRARSPRAMSQRAGRARTSGATPITVQRCGTHPCPPGGCAAPVASSLVREVLAAPGNDLDKPAQAMMEARLGHDFRILHVSSRRLNGGRRYRAAQP